MRFRFRYAVVASAAAAIMVTPTAAADNSPTCTDLNGSATTACSTPGNVQINDSPSADTFTLPYWDEVFGGGAYPGPYPVPYGEG